MARLGKDKDGKVVRYHCAQGKPGDRKISYSSVPAAELHAMFKKEWAMRRASDTPTLFYSTRAVQAVPFFSMALHARGLQSQVSRIFKSISLQLQLYFPCTPNNKTIAGNSSPQALSRILYKYYILNQRFGKGVGGRGLVKNRAQNRSSPELCSPSPKGGDEKKGAET